MRSIVYQQLSLKAAGTIYGRLKSLAGGRITARRISDLTPGQLRSAGISRQKATYLADLSARVLSGKLPLAHLSRVSDDRVRELITSVKGLGPWSADMYLIFVLNRPNILPTLDVGVRIGIELVYGTRPDAQTWDLLRKRWSPYCSVAAWYMWARKNREA